MNRNSTSLSILLVLIICISSGCTDINKESSTSPDVSGDQITGDNTSGFDESIEQLKIELEKDDGIKEVSFLVINGEKILVVLLHDPFEADAYFEYSSEMCDQYLKGYDIGNVTIDVRLGNEQLVYDVHRLNS
ncbi:hypothetical protein [Methanococcoides sp. AM1]|uniref:hypothetical protein n=1 Tax=Methanococcoides sp. AM1 TaxID=1201011 RepID=UPI001083513D|nr:hypothetical protein [Methanococcoides sp. AM1]